MQDHPGTAAGDDSARSAAPLPRSETPRAESLRSEPAAPRAASVPDTARLEEAVFELKKVIVGQDRGIERLFVCLL